MSGELFSATRTFQTANETPQVTARLVEETRCRIEKARDRQLHIAGQCKVCVESTKLTVWKLRSDLNAISSAQLTKLREKQRQQEERLEELVGKKSALKTATGRKLSSQEFKDSLLYLRHQTDAPQSSAGIVACLMRVLGFHYYSWQQFQTLTKSIPRFLSLLSSFDLRQLDDPLFTEIHSLHLEPAAHSHSEQPQLITAAEAFSAWVSGVLELKSLEYESARTMSALESTQAERNGFEAKKLIIVAEIATQQRKIEALGTCMGIAERNREALEGLLSGPEVLKDSALQSTNATLALCKDSLSIYREELALALGDDILDESDNNKVEIVIEEGQRAKANDRLIPGDEDVEPQPESDSEPDNGSQPVPLQKPVENPASVQVTKEATPPAVFGPEGEPRQVLISERKPRNEGRKKEQRSNCMCGCS